MEKLLAAAIVACCAGALMAQAPAEKPKAAPEKAAAATPAPAPAAPAAPAAAPRKAPAAKPAPKPAEEPEESMVMIDDRAEIDNRAAYAQEPEERPRATNGIPASLGQCRGVTTDAGRTILVFENADSGDISFVQVTFGKTGASWRVLDSLPRSGGEVIAGGLDAE